MEVLEALDPSTGELIGTLPRATPAGVDRAVERAHDALRTSDWLVPARRAEVLHEIGARLLARSDELALLECSDTGKPLSQARADVAAAARYFSYYAGAADKIHGSQIPLGPDVVDYTVRVPWGVCGQIIPWNYPLQVSARCVAPALAAGNAVVLKPSEEASLTPVSLGGIARDAGLPDGLLAVLPGLADVGTALVAHAGVDHVTFVGSPAVGRQVAQAAAGRFAPVSLELGGKSPNVVFADADLERAVPAIVRSLIQNAGQSCSAGSRLLVESSRYDEVLSRVGRALERVSVGPGVDDRELGPLVSKRQFEHANGLLGRAIAAGADVVAGGSRLEEPPLDRGYYLAPTLLSGVGVEDEIWNSEVFGPVVAAASFDDDDQAISLANASQFGLVAGVWTRDLSRAHRVAGAIRAGQVFVNTFGVGGWVEIPFGGFKSSGYGRGKGLEAIQSYTQVKNVCIQL
jgi:aldehyde dehydrogenase (NAD+)/betaine-aldehyde dehydrogenase